MKSPTQYMNNNLWHVEGCGKQLYVWMGLLGAVKATVFLFNNLCKLSEENSHFNHHFSASCKDKCTQRYVIIISEEQLWGAWS